MATGKVKFFSEQKGWGFLVEDDTNRELFVHFTDLVQDGFKTLVENERVSFEAVKTDKGVKAQNVKRIA